MNWPKINRNAECTIPKVKTCNAEPTVDPRCADPAWALQHPEVCATFPRLEIRPAVATVPVLGSTTYKAFLIAGGKETELESGVVFKTASPTIAVIGAVSGNATGLTVGVTTISAEWQDLYAYAQLNVIASCDASTVGICVVVDQSRSMGQEFGGLYSSKLSYAKNLAKNFIDSINTEKDLVSVVRYDSTATVLKLLDHDKAAALAAVDTIESSTKYTSIGDGLIAAIDLLTFAQPDRKVVILLSDCENKQGLDPVFISKNFRDAGGIIVVVGIRAHGAGYILGQRIASGGFFLNAHNTVAEDTKTYLRGLKSYFCSGDCAPDGDEISGNPELKFGDFDDWDVTGGTVDLIGSGATTLLDLLPGNGLYVDLGKSGILSTKDTIATVAGRTYRITLRMAGNQRKGTGADETGYVNVLVEGAIEDPTFESAEVNWKSGFKNYTFEWTEGNDDDVTVSIYQLDGGDTELGGVLLDRVIIECITEGEEETFLDNNFNSENLLYVPPKCGLGTTPAPTLISVDAVNFNATTPKDGAAAIGEVGDEWNYYPLRQNQFADFVPKHLRYVDNVGSGIRMVIGPDLISHVSTASTDEMLDSAWVGGVELGKYFFDLYGLIEADYQIYLYGHGEEENEGVNFRLYEVNTTTGATVLLAEKATGQADMTDPFEEDEHYVKIQFHVNPARTYRIVFEGRNADTEAETPASPAYFNGFQLLRIANTIDGDEFDFGYNCYNFGCLDNPPPAQTPDPNPPIRDVEDGNCVGDECPPELFTSTQSFTATCPLDADAQNSVTKTATRTGATQAEADRLAFDAARQEAEVALVCNWTCSQTKEARCESPLDGSPVSRTASYTSQISKADACLKAGEAAQAAAERDLVCQLTSLSGLRWQLPCLTNSSNCAGWDGNTAPGVCQCCSETFQSTFLTSTSLQNSSVYNVTTRFRGWIEGKNGGYSGGTDIAATSGTSMCVKDATVSPVSPYNTYALIVDDPYGIYYINKTSSIFEGLVDYSVNIPIRVGSRVTLYANSVDLLQAKNSQLQAPSGVLGLIPVNAGQFLQMDVTNIAIHPDQGLFDQQHNRITIVDNTKASPYPAVATVSGETGDITKVTVTLNGLSHKFWADIGVMLVSPTGKKVMLMYSSGGGVRNTSAALVEADLTFDDDAADYITNASSVAGGTFKPTVRDSGGNAITSISVNAPSPAPAGPYSALLSNFNGDDPNGVWKLYVWDKEVLEGGYIDAGFDLTITTD